ncbi:Uncharacterised protein [Mycobacteroides abscessus subsp. abscessus]|nr:Uncharacterised protein [Mycobacteroides abscessus subsp. abscessus]
MAAAAAGEAGALAGVAGALAGVAGAPPPPGIPPIANGCC